MKEGAENPIEQVSLVLERRPKVLEFEGQKAELSRANLEGADLTGARLQGAALDKANLKGADLSLADLQDACLIRANLQGAKLFGAKLRGADLQGATLEGTVGLVAAQLARANLYGASLPKSILPFQGLLVIRRASKTAHRLFIVMLLISVYAWLVLAATTDIKLLSDEPSSPLPVVGTSVSIVNFCFIVPLLLLGLYTCLHYCLQRQWEALAMLPAIFPDGQRLDSKTEPALLMALVRDHFKWLKKNSPPVSALEKTISMLLAYWVVPATLFFFWIRYLTRQDLHGSWLHVVLLVVAMGLAMLLPDLAERTLATDDPQPQQWMTIYRSLKVNHRVVIPAAVAVILFLLSLGTTYGVPQASIHAPELEANHYKRWAAHALWTIGYSAYADLPELEISKKPRDWKGRDEEIKLVKGARLNKAKIRYAEAYRAFLVNANLWGSDLEGAFLSEADLRGANLRQAKLRFAILDRANFGLADLQQADLQGANAAGADFQRADISSATLVDTILVDSSLKNANFYGANLSKARLLRADLEEAKLTLANLHGADLWSAKLPKAKLQDAQLREAFLIEADLRGADLGGADLQAAILRGADLRGAILHGADFTGASLEGADLRGVSGATAEQICSATVRNQAKLDANLETAVERQCGGTRLGL